MEVEKICNEIYNENYIIPQEEILYRVDTLSGRVYAYHDETENDIKLYPSVTSIISKYSKIEFFLFKWWCDKGYEEGKRIFNEAAQYGTFQHIEFKNILLGKLIDISETGLRLRIVDYCFRESIDENTINIDDWIKKSKQDTLGIIRWVQKYQIEPISIEMTLFSKSMKYAGTLDLVCLARQKKDQDKKLILVDYKTGRDNFYPDYIDQLEAYKLLWNEKHPESPIEGMYSLGAKNYRFPLGFTVDPFRFENQTDKKTKWKYYYAMFLEDFQDFIPEPKTVIIDAEVNINTDINGLFDIDDPIQNLKQELENENKQREQE